MVEATNYCVECYSDLVDDQTGCNCFPGEPSLAHPWAEQPYWLGTSDFVVRKIPFYDGKTVQAAIHGRLRGRGQRTGFKSMQSPVHKMLKRNGGDGTYKMKEHQLSQHLPHHMSTSFTLYNTRGAAHKVYTDFKGIREDGKIVIRLVV